MTEKRSFSPRKLVRQPSKGLGQSFLVDKEAINKLVKAAELKETDIVIEVGPGTGNLTKALSEKAKLVIAIEKDSRLVPVLEENLKQWGCQNVKIICQDALKTDLEKLHQEFGDYKVAANLPFYIGAPFIRKMLEAEHPPRLMALLVQKEVGQRICAKPPEMSLLAVAVQFYSQPEIAGYVSKKSFWPKPKVDGVIVKLPRITDHEAKIKDVGQFFKIVKAGFSHPRKQLANNFVSSISVLSAADISKRLSKEKTNSWLLVNNIQPSQRAETLTVDDWVRLAQNFVL